ncbi:DUF349 domain-containing protein [Dermacoccaceae bacterium W4C1]
MTEPTHPQPTSGEETESVQPTEPVAQPEAAPEPAAAAQPEAAPEPAAAPSPAKPSAPKPGKPSAPSPAAVRPRQRPAAEQAPATVAESGDAASFGRVGDDGTVFVRTPDGERAVGSYPDKGADEALAYFVRKFEELWAAANLLLQRVTQTDLSTKDGQEALTGLRTQIGEANVVGDLVRLDSVVEQIATALTAKAQVEGEQRAVAKKASAENREKVVAEAEKIAAVPVEKVQWKQSTARMRELMDEWKALQRKDARLDKQTENELWKRFSAARNSFDKSRRTFFSKLDAEHGEAKATKTKLVEEAEKLATSKDWGPTASAFKQLMSRWRQAGRASRADDDALWQRFKAAQDSFFAAKDEVVAAENVEFEANLKVKEELLTQAQALLPVKDAAAAKAGLRPIQEKWEAAGKVPRKDLERIERAMRKVEQAIRDAEDAKWKRTDPELSARAQSMVSQLESAVADLQADLDKAKASGDAKKIAKAQEALDARQAWLDQARSGLAEFGG